MSEIILPEGPQNPGWSAYNLSQIYEKELVLKLLYELCQGVESPEQEKGHSRIPLCDMLFSTVMKSFCRLSTRRFMSDVREYQNKGLLSDKFHFNSLSNYLRLEMLTPYLQQLIEQSSLPLKAVESFFAVDSTGLSLRRKRKWYNRHQKKLQERREWVKLHASVGTQTNIIICAEISHGHAHDSPFFKDLIANTSRHFKLSEVSADAAYLGAHNQRQVLLLGGLPYIAFRSNSTPDGEPKSNFWKRMLALYKSRSPEFMSHYYKRNNVESTFFMLKERFGESLFSKSHTAQVNEALCMVLCHNLCVLVQSIYELGIEPDFWTETSSSEENSPNVPTSLKVSVPPRLIPAFGWKSSEQDFADHQEADEIQEDEVSGKSQLSLFSSADSETSDKDP